MICLVMRAFRLNGHGKIWVTITLPELMVSAFSIIRTGYILIRRIGILVQNSSYRSDNKRPFVYQLPYLKYIRKDNGYIYGAPFSFERTIRGNIPAGRVGFGIKGDIPDPGLLLGEKLAEHLQKSGVNIRTVETARNDYILRVCNNMPQSYRVGEVLYIHRSRPLSDIIREINVESNNHYAEHLIRTIGRMKNANIYSDPLKEGIDFVNTFWKSKGISTSSLFMTVALAPQNAVSPVFLCDLLSYMHKKSLYSKCFSPCRR